MASSHPVVAGVAFGGDCSGVATVDNLVSCMQDTHGEAAVSVLADLHGPTLVGQRDAQRCRKTGATECRKLVDKRLREARKCRDAIDKGKLPASTNCLATAEQSDKLSRFEQRSPDKLDRICGSGAASPFDVAEFPAPCDKDDSGRLYTCQAGEGGTTTHEFGAADSRQE